ncbi:hypothetical protein SADUNF_Sadunf07G0084700 [Salix dunnii]|uniref:Uncharacterized protein n=1 Tax=Salix dunnii TaxID=1413687 RepID=A0A835MVH7_9ROSI|nr:hypothetical protein SADUNF_Sadunf07G0084700 [Salix dunnii]
MASGIEANPSVGRSRSYSSLSAKKLPVVGVVSADKVPKPTASGCNSIAVEMKFLDWYVKISAGGALIGASMELFMIKTGFCVTVLESEKRAWESSPEAQAIREALNPWRNQDTEQRKNA